MPTIGIIGGSGVYEIPGTGMIREVSLKTPFGNPSDRYRILVISGKEVAFLLRHGVGHLIPPHKINYRANIWGFKELDVKRILSIGAAGGINSDFQPGDIVILDQVIDMTRNRIATFYEKDRTVHIDFTEPYCPELRKAYLEAASALNMEVHEKGTYICSEGPRLESKAEIGFFSSIGADVVGMTGMPEACLARELELCYSAISVVTNYAAGIRKERLTVSEVMDTMNKASKKLNRLVSLAVSLIPEKRGCTCKDSLRDATLSP